MKTQIAETVINCMGNPNFNLDEVFQALENVEPNSSLISLLNALPELEKLAKDHYLDNPYNEEFKMDFSRS